VTDYTFSNPDGSAVVFSVSQPEVSGYQFTPGPPVVCPPTPLMRLGTSYKSTIDARNWPNTKFGLIFFNPANGTPFSLAAVQAAMVAWPSILWCICDKGDATSSVQQLITLPGPFWYAYDQEPEGEDPAKYKAGTMAARSAIDAGGARGRITLVGKFACYPEIQKPGSYKSYWCGTKDNPIEEVFGGDSYARPGIQFPTTSYGSSELLYGWSRDAAASLGVPFAITETGRLTLAADPNGATMAGVIDDDVAWARRNESLIWSYWPGKGGSTNPDGSQTDFTPPALVRAEIKTNIRSQG